MFKTKFFKSTVMFALVGAMMSLATGSTVAKAATTTSIEYFNASANEVTTGETVELSWKADNAKYVQVFGPEGTKDDDTIYSAVDSTEVFPTVTGAYELVATGFNGETVSKELTITVKDNAAKIASFTASKTEVAKDEMVTLSWKAENVKYVQVFGPEGTKDDDTMYSSEDSTEVFPSVTGTYTLVATGLNGETVSKELKITVKDNVAKIGSFTASKTEVSKGAMVTLSWNTENVVSCSIATSAGRTLNNRPANGSISMSSSKTVTYTLIATDAQGNKLQESVTVVVKK